MAYKKFKPCKGCKSPKTCDLAGTCLRKKEKE